MTKTTAMKTWWRATSGTIEEIDSGLGSLSWARSERRHALGLELVVDFVHIWAGVLEGWRGTPPSAFSSLVSETCLSASGGTWDAGDDAVKRVWSVP